MNMPLAVTYLDIETVKSATQAAMTVAQMPVPRELSIFEDKTYDDEDVIIVRLGVGETDNLGTAQQRATAIGKIQTFVSENGDPRTIFFKHVLVDEAIELGRSK
jgi:hypothetical protein